ncbi:hypothetical protein IMG5_002930 [Ichthyophthirius multifiliis]|uniref:GPR1/FUN34/yaaH family protein n=1 Tax=Ichthyophthirius multifiliis TaxID=5932 RepID=G0QJ70_ICHMU|nr:hypothetical protein IMG5_002930 [Ichthyophthirius multifiliis]EGR34721.1 hypothetical protein IMG5_002930 [Ichthyophthirius multifiliis]|eukprot:XP_004040025.1 hypothetical protein IMG5_002930 [Ichthyophthirius multifiliis]
MSGQLGGIELNSDQKVSPELQKTETNLFQLVSNLEQIRHKEMKYIIDLESLSKGKTQIELKDTTSNPGPLGLLGFGLTTFLLNVHNVGFYEFDSMIMGMGIFYGGIAQLIAGIMEWKKNNLFGSIAFISYGSFWISLIGLLLLPKTGAVVAANNNSMGTYMLIWGIFTLGMLIATLKRSNRALKILFFTLFILFMLLSIHFYAQNAILQRAAGVDGIFCGLLAIYIGIAEILNQTYGTIILPLGALKN